MNDKQKSGAYDLEGFIWHQHSPKLMLALLDMWPKDIPIVDLGCGLNYYVSCFLKAGYSAYGYDAAPNFHQASLKLDVTEEIHWVKEASHLVTENGNSRLQFWDRKPTDRKRNVLSLEVGEHLDPKLTDAYMDNIVRVANGGDVVLSWAVPGQPGYGHINCLGNSDVIAMMESRGYHMNKRLTQKLRDAVIGCHCTWFLCTLMYYEKTQTNS